MAMRSIRAWYLDRIVHNVPFVLARFDEKRGVFTNGDGRDHLYRHCLRPLAFLHGTEFPGNAYFGDAGLLDKVIRQGDAIVAAGEEGDGNLGVEWIPLNLVECIDMLGDELGAKRVGRWRAAIGRHLDAMRQVSNYIATAPNHFVWRAALLARAGALFENDEWTRAGRFLARQVSKMQTLDGYWDEAHRGQGPSPSYHRTHLHGLDLYYRFSGDEEVGEALYRGIDFAVRAAFPDGTPVDCFDGRQPYLAAFAAGMAANALTRTAQGGRLVARQCERLDELGVTDATSPVGFALSWYVFATTDFMLDCALYAEEGEERPLPQEADGHAGTFMLTGQQEEGHGVVTRRGAWFAAASAAESDVPRFISNVYITERQSGLSLWHERAGLVAGGGNRMRDHVPFANAVVLTGWRGVDAVGGVFTEGPIAAAGAPNATPETAEHADPVKCTYHPIRRAAEVLPDGVRLTLDFLHATIRLDACRVDDSEFEVRYAYESAGARKILLQVPVPLFYPGRFRVDGEERVADVETLATEVVKRDVTLAARGALVRYVPAAGAPTVFTWALEPIRNWTLAGLNYERDPVFSPLYTVGLLSSEFAAESAEGTLLRIEVAATETK